MIPEEPRAPGNILPLTPKENHAIAILPIIAPPEPFKALIFDCDGTLADTMTNHYVAWSTAMQANGADISRELFYKLAGWTTRDMIKYMNTEFGYGLDVEKVYHDKEERYLELAHEVQEISAVADVARAYHGVVPMAVATGGTKMVVDATLNSTGLISLFDTIVSADDVANAKPAPDMFLLAAKRMQVDAKDCVVYEDGDPGVQAAHAAGMRVVDVRILWSKR